jgi:hypothetical protein
MRNTKVAAPKVVGQRIPTTHPATLYTAASKPSHTPAVPISIYRELATELQTTKETVISLTTQNQQLTEQNQLLRQELERIANRTQKAVKYLDQLQDSPQNFVSKPQASKPQIKISSDVLVEDYIDDLPIVPEQFYRAIPEVEMPIQSEPVFNLPTLPKPKLVYEQAIRKPLRYFSETGETEMPAWKVSALIALIVCSAFGAGFLIVRPLIQGSQQAR